MKTFLKAMLACAVVATVAMVVAFVPFAGTAVSGGQGSAAAGQAAADDASAPVAKMAGKRDAKPRDAGASVASAPVATAPAVEEYPPPELVAACRREAQSLRARLRPAGTAANGAAVAPGAAAAGEFHAVESGVAQFHVIVKPPFVIAGNMSAGELEVHARSSVTRPAEAMWASYFKKKPDRVITVLLFTDDGVSPPRDDRERGYVYRAWAKKLFGDTDVSYFGYYKPDVRTMVMNIDTGGGTLVHELTHALIVYDFPGVPDWFNEGLGSLHEQCTIEPDEVIGHENWRLPGLQRAIRAGKLRPLRDLVTQDNFRDARLEGINYAQARYFVMYMQTRGLLKDFYVYLRDHSGQRDAAVAGVEKLFKDKIEHVEKDYVAWVKTLRFRAGE